MLSSSSLRVHVPDLVIAGALGILSMGFQLVASRILSPYFGSSIIVWAWLISTFLAAFSTGSLAGGWLVAGSMARRTWSIWVAVAAALFLLLDAGLGSGIAALIATRFGASHFGLPIVCLMLFWPPVTALSCMGPLLVARAAERGMRAGLASGLFAAASTTGNIAGVMVTAFILIPTIGSASLLWLWALAGALVLAVFGWRLQGDNGRPAGIATVALLCVVAGASAALVQITARNINVVPRLAEKPITIDSVYNHLVLQLDGTIVSLRRTDKGNLISAVDLADPQRQVLPYLATFFAGAMLGPPPAQALHIGLGGGAFNHLFTAAWPDADLTSVEIDPAVFDVARTYMGLQPSAHDKVEIADGRQFLASHPGPWNWILLDAYIHGGQVQPHLRTLEFYQQISRDLAPGGLLIDNLQMTQKLFASDVATLRAAFPDTMFFTVPPSGNVVAVAANKNVGFPSLAERLVRADPALLPAPLQTHLDLGAIRAAVIAASSPLLTIPANVLTDNFAPAEYLDAMPAR